MNKFEIFSQGRQIVDRIRSFGLAVEEKAVFDDTLTLYSLLAIEENLPDRVANRDEAERLLFDTEARRFITSPDAEILRKVFTLGMIHSRKPDGSLKAVADELQIPWSKCISLFKTALDEVYINRMKEFIAEN